MAASKKTDAPRRRATKNTVNPTAVRAYNPTVRETLGGAISDERPGSFRDNLADFMVGSTGLGESGGILGGLGGVADYVAPFLFGDENDRRMNPKMPLGQQARGALGVATMLPGASVLERGLVRAAEQVAADRLAAKAAKEARAPLTATYEIAPAVSAGHVAEYKNWSPRRKQKYEDVAPYYDKKGNDALYEAAGFDQLPTRQGAGAYKNSLDKWEYNNLYTPRPLLDEWSPQTRADIEAIEGSRALFDANEAGAANFPVRGASEGPPGMLLDTGGRLPTTDEMRRLTEALEPQKAGYGATTTNQGALVFPFHDNVPALDAGPLQGIVRGAKPDSVTSNTVYVPGVGKWGENGIIPSVPFSGEGTMGALERYANASPGLAEAIFNSPKPRAILRAKIVRDLFSPTSRQDIQNTRRFFSEADWPKAVEMIRKGMTPAAALLALGYATNTLAEEPTR